MGYGTCQSQIIDTALLFGAQNNAQDSESDDVNSENDDEDLDNEDKQVTKDHKLDIEDSACHFAFTFQSHCEYHSHNMVALLIRTPRAPEDSMAA